MKKVGLHVVAAVVTLIALTGCGSTSVEGQAETTKPQAGEPTFDPCSIPDDALRAAGVDPASETRDILGVKQPGWNLCDWSGDGTAITVFVTAQGFDEVRVNDRFTNFTPVELDGREAFTFREVTDTRNEYCDVVFRSETDTVMIKSGYFTGRTPPEGPCPRAVRNAQILAPSIPQ
ncbi:DUF3558 domain-containing protein [Prescottella agglutinans]|uniref:DUF3558 domain-containing protein n=1 Tax=Prescottella agglutinans TaxID=1644129 RepID=A0ABT6MD88_9NOCA|nr:DUF3558 domain-containing protein [Prescottella agglutinans]MDH6282267.1 hypothetical protein [Prescottella agglutinans]